MGRGRGKNNPSYLKLNGDRSEDEFHSAVVKMLNYALGGLAVEWTHFPAGGYRLDAAARARLSRLGLRAGYPDLMFWWRPAAVPQAIWGRSMGIELKTAAGGLSPVQKLRQEALRAIGVPVTVCRREEEIIACLDKYQIPHRTVYFGGGYIGQQSSEGRSAAQPAEGAGQAQARA